MNKSFAVTVLNNEAELCVAVGHNELAHKIYDMVCYAVCIIILYKFIVFR
jgi:hypothetical protein